ncbi:ATP-binding protein [Treponema sp.]|uniref:AAA family ATPase n=1 Tax=Treponema sp. TaxID=166 RepID=UPI00257D2EF4|nr:ATP-binding protein [Treponema sp.]MBE6354508.1 ATP-binding protein [Treponema sp.]
MLLEMRFSNFFSIKDEVCIDFKAGNINTAGAKELSDNIFSFNDETLLKVQGLFGPNASGKSSILKAAASCVQIILESHLYNEGVKFNYMPFKFDGYFKKPSFFFIDFVTDGIEYEYSFTLTRNEILTEELYYYPGKRKAKIFTRDESKGPAKTDIYSFGEGQFVKPIDVAQSTGTNTLFISRASQMDREIAKKIYNYFRKEFFIGLPQLSGKYAVELFKQNKELILQALKMADSDIVDIDVKIEKKIYAVPPAYLQVGSNTIPSIPMQQTVEEINFYTKHKRNPDVPFHLEAEESAGTIQIFSLLILLLDVCKNGKTLILDEFDASLHTELAQFILDMVNASKSAQFLFTSHNTNLLDIKKMRRDQILFTNKKEDGSTEVYSLFDFKDFRENMDAEKCYLQGRFDAVPYINSSISIIKNLLGE